jgi:hypothetical protein
MSQVEVNNTINSVNVESTFNTIDVNNDISNVLIIPQEITNVVEVITPGPQGPPGPPGTSSFSDTGSFVTTSSFNAFTSSYNTGSFTGSFIGSLLVSDQFLLLAANSTANVDGGIVVQNNINNSGHTFGYATPENRWALQSSLNYLSTSFDSIDGYANTTQYGLLSALPLSPSYGGATYGYGNMYVATDTDEIFIWA